MPAGGRRRKADGGGGAPDHRPADHRLLIVFDTRSGQVHELARLYTDPALGKVNRCDLHPRWSRDGRQVCIDSVHEGERQMYVVDVGRLYAGD